MIDLAKKLRHVWHFPKEGIDFIDITTVLQDAEYFQETIRQMDELVKDLDYELIIGSESRGFIMGAPLAYAQKKGFIPVRKRGKLPYDVIEVGYDLEYGEDYLQMHVDAVKPGQRVLVVDDLLATGGTAKATAELVEKLGGVVAGLLFFIELDDLKGREKIKDYPVYSVVRL